MMSRNITKREKILLIVLAVLLLTLVYIFLVQRPVAEMTASAEARQNDAEATLVIEESKMVKLAIMKDKLAEVRGNKNVHPLADYNNLTRVVSYLNGVMARTVDYDLIFNDVEFAEYVAKRNIDMTFTCSGYSTAREIIRELENCPYHCEVKGVTMQTSEGGSDVRSGLISVRLSVVFYEYAEQAQKEQDNATQSESQ